MQYAGATASYEFNEFENATIASTARWAKLWGIISLVSGILVLILGVLMVAVLGAMVAASPSSGSSAALKPAMIVAMGAGLIPTALVSIIGGIFYLQSGNSLRRVVDTQGNDIPLMVDAVRSLSRAFMIEAIAMIVGFVIGFGIGLALQVGGHS